MRKRLNLFSKKNQKEAMPLLSAKNRLYATIAGIVLFVVFLIINFFQFSLQKQVTSLEQKKSETYSYLLSVKDIEAKAQILTQKETQLQTYLKDNVEFIPYYKVLTETQLVSRNSDNLGAISISKDKSVEFSYDISPGASLIEVINVIESSAFLDKFEYLKMSSFSLGNAELAKGYKLVFKGKFNPI